MRLHRNVARRSTAGVSLLEVIIALALLGTILTTVAQLSVRVQRYRRNSDQRRVALREAANLMEMLQSGIEQRSLLTLSPDVAKALPSAQLKIDVAQQPSTDGRRLTVEIQWSDSSGVPVTPVTLVAWR